MGGADDGGRTPRWGEEQWALPPTRFVVLDGALPGLCLSFPQRAWSESALRWTHQGASEAPEGVWSGGREQSQSGEALEVPKARV